MSDHTLPTTTSSYTTLLTEFSNRIADAMKISRSDLVTITANLITTGYIRLNTATKQFEEDTSVNTTKTWTAIALNAATVTTNANLTGPITSVGNATSVNSQTGTGSTFVMNTSPTLVTPNIGAATGTSLSVSGSVLGTTVAGFTNNSTGHCGLSTGSGSATGYVTFFSAGQVRQGYIGFASSTATADAGTIPYVAGTHAFTGNITGGILALTAYCLISSGAANASLYLDSNATLGKYIHMRTATVSRWIFGTDTAAESGSNAGSNFFINRYNDAGTYVDTPLQINRATGNMTYANQITATKFNGPVTALKSATTSVDVSAATAPTVGQVLVATGSTAATWQTVSGVPDFMLINAGIF